MSIPAARSGSAADPRPDAPDGPDSPDSPPGGDRPPGPGNGAAGRPRPVTRGDLADHETGETASRPEDAASGARPARSGWAAGSRADRPGRRRWGRTPPARLLMIALVALAVVVAATACGRNETLGPAEAVEVLVLDGVPRTQATCMVDRLTGELDLAKVTGLDLDLSDDELAALAAAASTCAPTLGGAGGVVGGSTAVVDDPVAALAGPGANLGTGALGPDDIEDEVDRLIASGLELEIGTCLTTRLLREDDPGLILEDRFALSSLIVDCRESLGEGSRG